MITIRQAHISDAVHIAEGIYEAFQLVGSELEKDPGFHRRWIDNLIVVCAQPDTHYSYTNTVVAEEDGEIAGIMIAVDGKNYRIQREKMYPQLKSLFDEVFGLGWEDMEDEAQAGEFYVDSLAVFTPYRHRGIGTSLLIHAKKRAKELGIPIATLAVEPMNPAKTLYQEIGFRYNRPITIFNEEYHLYMADAYEK
jgi:ribosomal protein S18 acetylase RimI-like enzyme